jgi:hypothetical protein
MKIVLLFGFMFSATLLSQSTDAALSGAITDPTGALIANAPVVAENLSTGIVHKTKSNESGVYLFPALPPGAYRLRAEARGFAKLVIEDVVLELTDRITIDLPLEMTNATESVEVHASAETAQGYAGASVEGVISGQRVRDLPLPSRNAMDLVLTQAGLNGYSFSGGRIGQLNITLDGINVQDNFINSGLFSTLFTSVDRIAEVRIITSPADAELGRGSGQIIFSSRSGTNEFHGSVFEANRNTSFTANNWFNNAQGSDPSTGLSISPRNFLIRNQFGARLGGPVIRNRTFFHIFWESQRIRMRNAVTALTFTDSARNGIFRFFPGAQNANANGFDPAVDLLGDPMKPRAATGDLQSVAIFGRDPNRMSADPTIQLMLSLFPRPNTFRVGDGLNTAGYTWQRPYSNDTDVFDMRIDHNINSLQRVTFTYNRETQNIMNGFLPQVFPQSIGGNLVAHVSVLSFALTSTLRSNLLNEFHTGYQRPHPSVEAPWDSAGTSLLPHLGAQPYLINFGPLVANPIDTSNDAQGRISPVYLYGDNISWLKGKHAFKGGVELRFVSDNSLFPSDIIPRVTLGPGSVALQNFSSIPGIGQNQAFAERLLSVLSGSVASVSQSFNSPGGPSPVYLPGEQNQRTWKKRELSLFFKDDFKVTRNLTLNLGVRYEYYGVPWEANGKMVGLSGGSSSIFGISGTTLGDLFHPGEMPGKMTEFQLIGPHSPNPGVSLYSKDLNNFAPAVGLSWSIPWFGKNKTVFRLGYGWAYEHNSGILVQDISGLGPGLSINQMFNSASLLNLTNIKLPLTPEGRPMSLVPFTDRSQFSRTFDGNLRTPYIQNWNVSLQRTVFRGATLEARYVGSKGTRLVRGANVNELNIFENGILDAFRITQAGGTAPLFNRIFNRVNFPGVGVVDGTTLTGSEALRRYTTTQLYFSSNDVAGLASFLNSSVLGTNERGGLLRQAGLPENFIVVNPQFGAARLTGNFANSTYHSLQVELLKRFAHSWTWQANYTFSKALGEDEGSSQEMVVSYRTLRSRSLDKRLLGFNATHIFRNSGTVELPFGPGRWLLGSSRGWVARLVEHWETGLIFNKSSGGPLGLFGVSTTFNGAGGATPVALSPLRKDAGSVTKTGNGVVYFQGLFSQTTDPAVASMAAQLSSKSTMRALTDAQGKLLVINPAPGTLGNLAPYFLSGPGSFRLDVDLIKRIQITEHKNLEFRVDALSLTNTPQFGSPVTDINSTSFGRITTASESRVIVLNGRLNF